MAVYATIHNGRVEGISRLSKAITDPPPHLVDISMEPDPDHLLGWELKEGRFTPPLAPEPEGAPVGLAGLWARLSDAEQDEILIGRNKAARRLLAGLQVQAHLPRARLRATLAEVLTPERAAELTDWDQLPRSSR